MLGRFAAHSAATQSVLRYWEPSGSDLVVAQEVLAPASAGLGCRRAVTQPRDSENLEQRIGHSNVT